MTLVKKDSTPSKDAKEDKTVANIVAGIGLAIMAVVIGFMIFGDRSDCGIDKASLPCRWTGSIFDILGLIIFLAGCIWNFGLGSTVYNFFSKKEDINVYELEIRGKQIAAWVGIAAAVLGLVMIYT